MPTAELTVTGMHCQSCAALIEETLTDEPGVAGARVDLDKEQASVTYDEATINLDHICTVIKEVGYTAQPANRGNSS